jgi:hypothetical protein
VLRWETTMAKVLSISIITTAAKTAARLIVRCRQKFTVAEVTA